MLLLLAVLTLISPSAQAYYSSTLLSQGFSGTTFPPTGWTDYSYGAWSQASNGMGGANGSAIVDMWDYYYGYSELSTPVLDASPFRMGTDTAYLDFDYYMERNQYYDWYYIDDQFLIILTAGTNKTTALTLKTGTDYTQSTGTTDIVFAPPTSSGYWKHIRVGIPQAYRTSGLQIVFSARPDWGIGNVAIDNVVVTGKHYNALLVSPTGPITFGSWTLGDTSTVQKVYLTNPNNVAINLSNLTVSGDFLVVSAPSTIPAAGSVATVDSILVAFVPTGPGYRGGTLSFNTDADIPTSVSISLQGSGLSPQLSMNGVSILFSKTRVKLRQSVRASFLISNTGFGKLDVLSSTHIGGDYPGEYQIVKLPTGGIPTGLSDTVTIQYNPTMEGQRPADLFLVTNGGSAQVSLRGIGILPHLTLSTNALAFDSIVVGDTNCQYVTLTNSGSDTLIITRNYFVSGDLDFTLTPLTGQSTIILPTQSAQVQVCFTPLQKGIRQARLRLTTNIPMTFDTPPQDTSTFIVNISGTGVPIGQLAMVGKYVDSSIVGQEHCKSFTVRNLGAADLTITNIAPQGGDAGDFRYNGTGLPVLLRAGQSMSITICFKPTARGPRQTNIVFTSVSGERSEDMTVPTTSYGLAVCSSLESPVAPGGAFEGMKTLLGKQDRDTVTVQNCGDVVMTFTANLSQTGSDYALVGPATVANVAPGSTASFELTFAPQSMGSKTGSLTVTGSSGVTPLTVPLMGAGGAAVITATATVPNVIVGNSKTFGLTLTNAGNVAWTPGAPTIVPSGEYAYVSGGSTAIAAGGSGTLQMTFTPTATGTRTAVLTFPNSTPTETPVLSYTLAGRGDPLSVAPTSSVNGYELDQNRPNPARTTADIRYLLPVAGPVLIVVQNATGETIRTIVSDHESAGEHHATFDASTLPSGSYFYTLISGEVRITRQMTLIR